VNKSLISGCWALLSLFGVLPLNAEPVSNTSKPSVLKHFSACQGIQFEAIDTSELTQQERIELKEKGLKASLNNQAECLDETMNEQQSRLNAASGQQSGGLDMQVKDPSSTEALAAESSKDLQSIEPLDKTDKSQSKTTQSKSTQSKSHPIGQKASGASAVCDAIKQGLAKATTETEKRHFEGLVKEYGCK
jgi:hypothetical protein